MSADRIDYIAGLRQLADFLEANPELPTPYNCNHLIPVATRAELVAVARVPGVRWEKDWSSTDYFSIKTRFAGRHAYDVYVERGVVCRKVVTGARIEPARPQQLVEEFHWVCDEPLLSETARASTDRPLGTGAAPAPDGDDADPAPVTTNIESKEESVS